MRTDYALKNNSKNKCVCVSVFGDSNSETDTLSLKSISELMESGYEIIDYEDDCYYLDDKHKWKRQIFIGSGL
jgi:hypothetical protein